MLHTYAHTFIDDTTYYQCIIDININTKFIIKPGMPPCGRHAPGFLELLLSANVCIRACVCVSAPKAINN